MLKIPQINGHVFNGSSIIFCLKECSGKQRKCNLSAATSSRLDGSVTTSLWNESLHLTASPEENGVTADTGLAPLFLSLKKQHFHLGDLQSILAPSWPLAVTMNGSASGHRARDPRHIWRRTRGQSSQHDRSQAHPAGQLPTLHLPRTRPPGLPRLGFLKNGSPLSNVAPRSFLEQV